jgi:hypothetical protein
MTGLSQRGFGRKITKVTALIAASSFSININGKQDEHGGAVKLAGLLDTINQRASQTRMKIAAPPSDMRILNPETLGQKEL